MYLSSQPLINCPRKLGYNRTCIPFASDYAVHNENTHAYTNYVHDGLLSRGNNSVCLYRLLKVHSCQIKISYDTTEMQKEFSVGDRVAVGENEKKRKIVNKYKSLGTYTLYTVHLFHDGTFVSTQQIATLTFFIPCSITQQSLVEHLT